MFVCILQCADASYYVGTYRGDDIDTRVGEHNLAHYPNAWTSARRPVRLLWCQWFDRAVEAAELEKRLKKWSRAKKEAFMDGDQAKLKALSVSRAAPADPRKSRLAQLLKADQDKPSS